MQQTPCTLSAAQRHALWKYIHRNLGFYAHNAIKIVLDIEALLADPCAPAPSLRPEPTLFPGSEVTFEGTTYVVESTMTPSPLEQIEAPEIALLLEVREKGTHRRRFGHLLHDGTVEVYDRHS